MNRAILSTIVAVLLGAVPCPPRAEAQLVHHVDNLEACAGLVPCYSTISAAVDAAASGDAISVFPGVYHESVMFSSKSNILMRAHIKALSPVIAAPAGGSHAVTILASPGVQVLNFVLESPEGAGVAILGTGSRDVVIEGTLIRAPGGIFLSSVFDCVVRNNTMIGAGINGTLGAQNCLIDGNTVDDGRIEIADGRFNPIGNVIRRNVVRRGKISLSGRGLFDNTVDSNFVSASPDNGIEIFAVMGSSNLIQRNTSIDNAGCDITDTSVTNASTWRRNRFATKCGLATD